MVSLYEDAQRRERLAFVVGPPGSGKSMLLQAFHKEARLCGGVVLEGRCEPGTAFGPFAAIIERALAFLDDMDARPQSLAGLACLTGCHNLWHEHAQSDGHQHQATFSAHEGRLRFFDAVRDVFREVARFRPPLVLIHGLDRADEGTLQLLQFLFDGSGPWSDQVSPDGALKVLVVASLRTGVDSTDLLEALLAHDAAEVIRLQPFDVYGVRQLLQSEEVVRRVLERTGGSLSAIELLLEGRPLSASESLHRRLLQQPEDTLQTLKVMSVLDHPLDFEALRELCRQPDLNERELTASCFVLETQTGGVTRYSFLNAHEREALYESLPPKERIDLHRRCAERFERRPELAMAARHALLAGDGENALRLARREAQSLADQHAHAGAAALLELAMESASVIADDVLVQLSDLHRADGRFDRAVLHAITLLERWPADAAVGLRVGELFLLAGRLEDANGALTTAQKNAVPGGENALRAAVLRADVLYEQADYTAARAQAESSLQDALDGGLQTLEMDARNTLGKVCLAVNSPAEAKILFEQNQSQAERLGHREQHAKAMANSGMAALRLQHFDEATGLFERALAGLNTDSQHVAVMTGNLAVLAHLKRDYGRALRYYEESMVQLRRRGNRPRLSRFGTNMGELHVSLGDTERALSYLAFAQHMGRNAVTAETGETWLLSGRLELERGRFDVARNHLEHAERVFLAVGAQRYDATLELINVDVAEGHTRQARTRMLGLGCPSTPRLAAQFAIAAADIERSAGGDVVVACERAVGLAQHGDDDELVLKASLQAAEACTSPAAKVAHLEAALAAEARLIACVPSSHRKHWLGRRLHQRLDRLQAALGTRTLTSARHDATSARTFEHDQRYPKIVGSSPTTLGLLKLLDRVAPSDTTVLIRGESGTGKELVAEALHHHSARRQRPLVKLNCAALVETLLLSELFGHERGAFTGARARKKGRFEMADGGTLFLDEIGDISPATQVALLRVLQEREFVRVGGTYSIKVDVRIVAATHRDLEAMVAEGSFREDLYYRLRGVMVEVPPLRARTADLGELCSAILARIADDRGELPKQLASEVIPMLCEHRWPGNIRELENVLRGATLFADRDELAVDDFSGFAKIRQTPAPDFAVEDVIYSRILSSADNSLAGMKKQIERECILRALEDTDGNITKAAGLLGMKRPRVSQLVKQYRLDARKAQS